MGASGEDHLSGALPEGTTDAVQEAAVPVTERPLEPVKGNDAVEDAKRWALVAQVATALPWVVIIPATYLAVFKGQLWTLLLTGLSVVASEALSNEAAKKQGADENTASGRGADSLAGTSPEVMISSTL